MTTRAPILPARRLAEPGTVFGGRGGAAAMEALAALVDVRAIGTAEHSARVGELARATALALGFEGRYADDLYLAGRLHDIGKAAIPDSILNKRTELTPEEWQLIHRHPTIGADIVSHVASLARLAPAIRTHHERYDGGGYPRGLRGEAIPLEGRIVAVADAFDAMISERGYARRMTVAQARARLRECAGTQFDPDVVAAFDRLLEAAPRNS